jgi:secreted PhoX family phosphatase
VTDRGGFGASSEITRRSLLGGIGALLVVAACSGKDSSSARSTSTTTTTKAAPVPAGAWTGPELATTPDANGLLLPEGFTSRVLATSGQPVGSTGYVWPPFPDGGATFPDPKVKGGWYYVANSESPASIGGGVSSIRFDPDGEIVDAYRLVGDTNINCAGGATPWGTWLTCEEVEGGRVLECDPTKPNRGQDRPALGRFVHEAACVDAKDRRLYLTEDRPDGLFYRFTPERWPDLDAGVLEAAVVDDAGGVTWRAVPDPSAATTPIRAQAFGATAFNGGEGIVSGGTPDGRRVWFSTKGDDVIHELDPAAATLREIYRGTPETALHGVDNLWWDEPSERLFVAEDGDDLELIVLNREGQTARLLQVTGHDGSEITGPALNPKRTTLLFSSQRGLTGTAAGVTFAVTGPFPPT